MTVTQGNDFTGTLDDNWGLVREVGLGVGSFDVVPLLPVYLRCISLLVLSDIKGGFRGQVVIVTLLRRYLSPNFAAIVGSKK